MDKIICVEADGLCERTLQEVLDNADMYDHVEWEPLPDGGNRLVRVVAKNQKKPRKVTGKTAAQKHLQKQLLELVKECMATGAVAERHSRKRALQQLLNGAVHIGHLDVEDVEELVQRLVAALQAALEAGK